MVKYQGWANYETWNLKLWIDNDEGSYRYWTEVAVEYLDRNKNKKDAISELAEMLHDETIENIPSLDGFYADVLTAAVSKVDWYEVAKDLIDEVG